MRQEIVQLREKMREHGIDFYLVPTTDYHGSEYVNEYFNCREFLSGFTGSAGTLLVGMDDAWLWTDGRYFLQAGIQLENSGVQLMKMGEPRVPKIEEHLAKVMKPGMVIGFDGRIVDYKTGRDMEEKYTVKWDLDLVDEIWENRPQIVPTEIYQLPHKVTGETSEQKLKRIRSYMKDNGVDYHLVTSLEDIAWTFNLRGSDVDHTPVFYAYALISADYAFLYTMNEEINGELPEDVVQRPYFQVFDDLSKLPRGGILLNEELASFALAKSINPNIKIVNGMNPAEIMKALKNSYEIESTRNAHIKDGVAMVNFIHWLKTTMKFTDMLGDNGVGANTGMTEIAASDYLEACRRKQEGFMDLSFDTISGYGPNGAIVHYTATPESDRELKPEGFLLVDSGAHYEDGSTDITRTIALGVLTDKMKEDYTTVLRGHIDLATAEFAPGTLGSEIDKIARKPLQERGLDYNHGTGHGVGHLLSIHEGPQCLSPRGAGYGVYEGMITSNEPGVYLEGEYGIRLENETLCYRKDNGMLGFETITFCPFEREAIVKEMMTEEELAWLNNYHSQVYQKLSPFLDESLKGWWGAACGVF
ncbi:MAG: aminopeptidase P family protein [Clostridia bacterium]|nr:aminopeptidase P family protein [Clostridia bacterium]